MSYFADRTKRVKEARDEARKEIEAYRKQKDEEFKKFEAEVCFLTKGIIMHHLNVSLNF